MRQRRQGHFSPVALAAKGRAWGWPVVLGLLATIAFGFLLREAVLLTAYFGFVVVAAPVAYATFCIVTLRLFVDAITQGGFQLEGPVSVFFQVCWHILVGLFAAACAGGAFGGLIMLVVLLGFVDVAALLGPILWWLVARDIHGRWPRPVQVAVS